MATFFNSLPSWSPLQTYVEQNLGNVGGTACMDSFRQFFRISTFLLKVISFRNASLLLPKVLALLPAFPHHHPPRLKALLDLSLCSSTFSFPTFTSPNLTHRPSARTCRDSQIHAEEEHVVSVSDATAIAPPVIQGQLGQLHHKQASPREVCQSHAATVAKVSVVGGGHDGVADPRHRA